MELVDLVDPLPLRLAAQKAHSFLTVIHRYILLDSGLVTENADYSGNH